MEFTEAREQIEAVRERLKSSSAVVMVDDYGAVAPDAGLTQDEMYAGRHIPKPVRELASIGLKENWALKLFETVKELAPSKILELGTCCGFSASYMAKAAPDARIITMEGADAVADLAAANFRSLDILNVSISRGRFQDTLSGVLEKFSGIDFALIDGHHDMEATVRYYQQIKGHLAKGASVFFDDISWSEGMRKAWDDVVADGAFEKYYDMKKLGICEGFK